ncbi:MAG: hypothetical protein KDD82_13015 [Planctomycetes bacterium]|nr:hypothetical protein [Planctomycetota bacterium]
MLRRLLVIGLLATFAVTPAWADQDEDHERKEFREAEGEGQEAAPEGQGEEDPRAQLQKILELMERAETKLFEADPKEDTQAVQKEIVEAMRFEDKTHEALEKLIHQIENQPP